MEREFTKIVPVANKHMYICTVSAFYGIVGGTLIVTEWLIFSGGELSYQ